MLKRIFILFLISLTFNIYSQVNNISTLEQKLDNSTTPKDKVKIYNELAFEYMYFDNQKSIDYAKKSLEYNNDTYLKEKITSLLILGFNDSFIDYLNVSKYTVDANKLIKDNDIKDKSLLGFSHYITGTSTIYTQYKKDSFDHILEANEIFFENKNEIMFNLTKNTLATLQLELGQLNKAKKTINETLSFFTENGITKYIILSTRKLALIHELGDEHVIAEDLYLSSVTESNNFYPILLPYTANSLMLYYINRGRFIDSLNIFNSYLEDVLDSVPILQKANIYNNLLSIHTELRNFDTALDYAKLISELDIENNNLLYTAYNQMGLIYIKQNRLDLTEDILLDVWEKIKNEQYTYIMINNLEHLEDLYYIKNDLNNQLKYTKIHLNKLNDYFHSNSYRLLIEAEEKFQIIQKEQKITTIEDHLQFKLISQIIISFLLILIIIGIIIQLRTVHKDKKVFENMARTDFLTNLFNRRTFLEKVDEENVRFLRSGNWFSIIISDIDNFKYFNDTFGHDCGDEVIKAVSNSLKQTCRKQDTIARWGGEEFILLLPSTSISGAMVIAERLRKKINEIELTYNNTKLKVNMTFGLAEYEKDLNIDQLIHNADLALLHGKEVGKDRVVTYSDIKDL